MFKPSTQLWEIARIAQWPDRSYLARERTNTRHTPTHVRVIEKGTGAVIADFAITLTHLGRSIALRNARECVKHHNTAVNNLKKAKNAKNKTQYTFRNPNDFVL